MGKFRIFFLVISLLYYCGYEQNGLKAATGSQLKVLGYDITNFPEVSAEYFFFENGFKPVNSTKAGDFKLSDNGIELQVKNIIHPIQNPLSAVSLTIAFDLAINAGLDTGQGFNLSQYISKLLSTSVLNGTSECAFTSFDQHNYLNTGFTKDSFKLVKAIDALIPAISSNYGAGIVTLPSGAIPISVGSKYDKVIVMISDRKNVNNYHYIIEQELEGSNIRFFNFTINYEIQDELKEISDHSGGKWFDNISDSSEAKKAVQTCLSLIYNYQASSIIFEPVLNCESKHKINLNIPAKSTQCEFMLDIADSLKPFIEVFPSYLSFSAVLAGATKDLNVVLTARNDDIKINDLNFSNSVFTIEKGGIIQGDPPITINQNSSRTITIRFTPLDSSLVFDSLRISSNACDGQKILLTGGFPNTPPKERNLTITAPVCGETLLMGDTIPVTWTGLLPNDVIQLEYTINEGQKWNILAKDINGLKYDWVVPLDITDGFMIRAIQLWPNNVGQTMDFHHKAAVNSANFNELGDMVVTASNDNTARVWNSNNGYEFHKLIDHKDTINYANFSPDGNRVITASNDSTVKVWDISKHEEKLGTVLYTLRGHKDWVMSANYSPDGNFIVSTSRDRTVKLWEAKTGVFIKNIEESISRMKYAEFSQDGKYLLTCGGSNQITIWNTEGWKLYKRLTLKNGMFVQANFSPDSKKLVSSDQLGRGLIWDVEKGDTIFSVTHSTDTADGTLVINSAEFDKSGKYFLTTSVDGAKMWDAETGKLLHTLKEHRGNVIFATFNFDGSRILTASWDSTAKIWNLNKRDLQMDSTDCLLAIDKASVQAEDIAMGDVLLGQSKFVALDSFLINNNAFQVRVKDITISGIHQKDFKIIEGKAPYNLEPMGTHPIEIMFSPSIEGLIEAKITINVPGLTLEKKLTGSGFKPELQATIDYIDFNEVEIGDYIDSTVNLVIKNVSKKNIKVSNVKLLGPDNLHFIILNGNELKTLKPEEGYNLTIRFIPEELERKSSKVVFEYDGLGKESALSLFGEGIKPRIDTATIFIDSFTGSEGKIYEVPIKVKNLSQNGFRESIKGFTCDISFNGTMLQPLFEYTSDRTENGRRILSIDIPSIYNSDSVFKKLKFKVALGNDTSTGLILSNLNLVGKGKTVLSLESGNFSLTGYCDKGGLRLFDSDGKMVLMQNRPNPFDYSTTIEFEVFEGGVTKLIIMDMLGKVVKTVLEEEFSPGVYTYNLTLRELPSGSYYYLLQTPTYSTGKRMEIRR